ncbi:MAG: hypothetical protein ABH879_09200 [archaeon]
MKRKVIRQGHNTLTLTLPLKWAKRFNVQPGCELEVKEGDSSLVILPGGDLPELSATVDISGLDRCSILYIVRNLYRTGYDEIELKFNTRWTPYYRIGVDLKTISVIKYELMNLIGYEVVEQGASHTKIKDISALKSNDFDNILRRIFLLLNECGKDLLEGLQNKDVDLVNSIQEKHNIITKFVSYCLRLLNKFSYDAKEKKDILYHVIASLDKIADVYKNVSRDTIHLKPRVTKKTKDYLRIVTDSMEDYTQYFYKFDRKKMIKLNQDRDNFIKGLRNDLMSLSKEEIILIKGMQQILEVIADLIVARMEI